MASPPPLLHRDRNQSRVNSLQFHSLSEDDTQRLGLALGRSASPGTVVALYGEMGSGKTRFVRAVVEGLDGSPTDVSSPTFVLLQQYSARLPVHHADAYRLTSETEFLDLGPEEWLTGPGVVLIEWADRISNCLPDDRVDVSITSTGETSRRFAFTAAGPMSRRLLEHLHDT